MQLRDDKGQFTSKYKLIVKYIIYLWVAVGILALIAGLLTSFNEFSSKKKMVWDKPIHLSFHKILTIVDREPLVVIQPWAGEVDEEYEELDDIEKLICDKWGMYECKTAIAIAKAESGLNPEAINYNTNGTYDIGLFQINSIHWDKYGGLSSLINVQNNIDAAYDLWQEQGWNPWTVFNTGAFKGNL